MIIERISKIPGGPVAGAPYSLGVVAEGKFLFVSGQGPYDPEKGAFVRGGIAEQTELTLKNVQRVVEAAGGSMKNVVSCRVFLQPLDEQNFKIMNEVYERFFPEGSRPVRTTVGATLLKIDVEIDAIVAL